MRITVLSGSIKPDTLNLNNPLTISESQFRRTSGQNLQASWQLRSLSLSLPSPTQIMFLFFPRDFLFRLFFLLLFTTSPPPLKSFFFPLCLRRLNCCCTQKMLIQHCRKEIGDDYKEYCFTDVMPYSWVQFYWSFNNIHNSPTFFQSQIHYSIAIFTHTWTTQTKF